LGSEERCLATRAEQKVRKDRPRPEKKLLDVETPIQTGLAKEIGDGKRATLDRLPRGRAPARPCMSRFVDLKRTHIEPEVLEVCKGLQHGGPLFQFIAPTTTLASTFGMKATKGQQFIDVCHGILLGRMCLIEPERAECVEGIGIKIREGFPLLPHTRGPHCALFRQQVRFAIDENGAELCHAAGDISGEKSGGPGDSVEALKGIQREGFPDISNRSATFKYTLWD